MCVSVTNTETKVDTNNENMDTLPVTLIVKAPNQQIEDQAIKCELSWTINKLKEHLSEVYPSKPPSHSQKLIYSGQLLSDTVVLKDVLRQYDGQDTHTVHLVCTPNYSLSPPKQQMAPPPTGNSLPTTTVTPEVTPTNSNTDQRVPPNMQWFHPPNDDQYAMQLAMMQQAYFQYMMHYMNLYAHTNRNLNSTPEAIQAQYQRQQAADRQLVDEEQNGVVNPAVQPAPIQQPQQDPEREANRDWLDVFYSLSRIMIFFSIVYFYSSPIRFVFVLFLGFGLYLYHIGFFRNVNNNNNNIVQGEAAEEQAPSRLMVVWTFFTTFFASLIPEIPNVV